MDAESVVQEVENEVCGQESNTHNPMPKNQSSIPKDSTKSFGRFFDNKNIKTNRTIGLILKICCSILCIIGAAIVVLSKSHLTFDRMMVFSGFITAAATTLYMTGSALMAMAEKQQNSPIHFFSGQIYSAEFSTSEILHVVDKFGEAVAPSERHSAEDINSIPQKIKDIFQKTGGKG